MEKSKDLRKEDSGNRSVLNILTEAFKNSYRRLKRSNEKIKDLESDLDMGGD